MIPVLYPAGETEFRTNGLGRLSEAIRCTVEEERNGKYELEMEYPETGKHLQDIALSGIICAVPFDSANKQPFRIYSISKPINGIVTVKAEHISYQLSHIPVSPCEATSCAAALLAIKNNAAEACPFTFWTDKNAGANFSIKEPASIRSILGGVQGSVIDTFGGEYEWDGYTVKLHSARGADRGVTLRYGKNITDIRQEENIQSTITGVYPYWKGTGEGEEEALVTLDEKVLHSANAANFPYQRTVPLDLSSEFQEAPTQDQLRARAQSYMAANKVGVPNVSIKVSFLPLWMTEEYANKANLERVRLCDTVTVEFPRLNIKAAAKVVSTKFDVLKERYESIELGDARTNLGSAIKTSVDGAKGEALKAIRETSSALKKEVARNTARITGADGGSIQYLFDANGNPRAIVALNTDSIDTATECLMLNYAGLGGSQNGIGGPFITAITSDGHINADMITVGHLLATLIRGGVLALGGTESDSSFGNGALKVYDANDNEIGSWDRTGLKASGDLTMIKDDQTSGLGTAKYIEYLLVEGLSRWADKTGFYAKKVKNGDTVSSFAFFPMDSSLIEQVYAKTSWGKTIVFAENGTTKGVFYFLEATKSGFTLKPYAYGNASTAGCIEFATNNSSGLSVKAGGADVAVGAHIDIKAGSGARLRTTREEVRLTNGQSTESYLSAGGVYADSRGIDLKSGANQLRVYGGGTTSARIYINAGTGITFAVGTSGAEANGSRLAYDSSSSRRYKHAIRPITMKSLDPHLLLDLPVAEFVFNEDHPLQYDDMFGKTIPGIIAEDVAEIYPAAAIWKIDGETGEAQVESWDERRILPGMLALIQEQDERIRKLEERLAEIEGRLACIENI